MYIGKSKNLKARIGSYFRSDNYISAKTDILIAQIKGVHVTKTDSELEALLLEASFIHQLRPKYNSRLKDDKSPIYVVISRETYPRIIFKRKSDLIKLKGYIFGENIFGPFLSSRELKIIMRQIRKIFPYCSQIKSGRACFYTHIGLCPGACSGKIAISSYRAVIRKIVKLLNGDIKKLTISLTKEMRLAAANLNFEKAQEKKEILTGLKNMLSIKLAERSDERKPDAEFDRLNRLINLLREHGVNISYSDNFRIEGYDISHLGGNAAAASMAVFVNGWPDNSEYRRFRIKTENTRDDPRMLAEAVRRRLTHTKWGQPNLILIDGGEPQLSAIQKEFKAINLLNNKIPYIGLVKGEERVIIPTGINKFISINQSKNHPGIQLLMAVRDESHRFARRYHHWLRHQALKI